MNDVITQITQIIGTLGFPIAMCVLMYTRENKTFKEFSEKLERMAIALEAAKK